MVEVFAWIIALGLGVMGGRRFFLWVAKKNGKLLKRFFFIKWVVVPLFGLLFKKWIQENLEHSFSFYVFQLLVVSAGITFLIHMFLFLRKYKTRLPILSQWYRRTIVRKVQQYRNFLQRCIGRHWMCGSEELMKLEGEERSKVIRS